MYKTIVVAVNLEEDKSIKLMIAELPNFASINESEVHFVYIVPHFNLSLVRHFDNKYKRERVEQYQAKLESTVTKYLGLDEKTKLIKAIFFVGDDNKVADGVINYANKHNASLIITSARNAHLEEKPLGSKANRILHQATVPVLIIN